MASAAAATAALAEKEQSTVTDATEVATLPAPSPKKSKGWGWKLSSKKIRVETSDPEKGPSGRQARPIRLFAPLYNGLGLALSLCAYLESLAFSVFVD